MQALSSRLRSNSAVRLRGGSERSDLLLRVRLAQLTRLNLDEPEALAVAQQLTLVEAQFLKINGPINSFGKFQISELRSLPAATIAVAMLTLVVSDSAAAYRN